MKHPHGQDSPGHSSLLLSRLGSSVGTRLQRLGLKAGTEYLAGAMALINPLHTEVAAIRHFGDELVLQAATAENPEALKNINNRVVEAGQSMFISLHSVPMVQEFCTAVRDAIAGRALELAKQRLYFSSAASETPMSLIAVGSHGRFEQTLFTDQDYLFIHGDVVTGEAEPEETASEYFGMLGALFVKIMEEAGITRCGSGIMPDNYEWRGSRAEWKQRFLTTTRFQHDDWAKSILNLIIVSDARYLSGDQDIWLTFAPFMRAQIRENSQIIRSMAGVASAMRLAKGFIRRFAVEADGPNKGAFNLKLLAWKPLVMCVRLLAIHSGIDSTSTLERIEMLQRKGILSGKLAAGLADSYHIITGRKILQQIKKIKGIIDDENYINPYELAGAERDELYKAITRIAELQNMIRKNYSVA